MGNKLSSIQIQIFQPNNKKYEEIRSVLALVFHVNAVVIASASAIQQNPTEFAASPPPAPILLLRCV